MDKQNRESEKILYYCKHCGEEIGFKKAIYCVPCRRKDNREELTANNERIIQGLTV